MEKSLNCIVILLTLISCQLGVLAVMIGAILAAANNIADKLPNPP
jgi:hypothetical protein